MARGYQPPGYPVSRGYIRVSAYVYMGFVKTNSGKVKDMQGPFDLRGEQVYGQRPPEMRGIDVAGKVQASKKKNKPLAEILASFGLVLIVAVFGGVFWAINGGFSVLGLETVCSMFESGKVFWRLMSSLTLPLTAQGQVYVLPILPWIGVVGITVLQCSTLYLKMKGNNTPKALWVAALVASLYDFGSTYSGLGTVAWLAHAGWVVQGVTAIFLTFLFELTVSWLLSQRK